MHINKSKKLLVNPDLYYRILLRADQVYLKAYVLKSMINFSNQEVFKEGACIIIKSFQGVLKYALNESHYIRMMLIIEGF